MSRRERQEQLRTAPHPFEIRWRMKRDSLLTMNQRTQIVVIGAEAGIDPVMLAHQFNMTIVPSEYNRGESSPAPTPTDVRIRGGAVLPREL